MLACYKNVTRRYNILYWIGSIIDAMLGKVLELLGKREVQYLVPRCYVFVPWCYGNVTGLIQWSRDRVGGWRPHDYMADFLGECFFSFSNKKKKKKKKLKNQLTKNQTLVHLQKNDFNGARQPRTRSRDG